MLLFFTNLKKILLLSIFFLFPFVFLPTTQEFFATNKLYFLSFGTLLLLLISTIEFVLTKKIVWKKQPFDGPVILFVLTTGLSIFISSPNKIQALLNPNFGLVSILSLTILYYYISRLNDGSRRFFQIVIYSSALLSIITIVFFFQPFKNTTLPLVFQFLKNPLFSPMGSQLDLAIFLGFFVAIQLAIILTETNKLRLVSFLIFNLIALSLTIYSLLKPISTNFNQFQPISTILPPFRLSWFAALEALKTPLNALFGIGVDNFSVLFTKVKDFAYNQSSLWQTPSFVVSRSTILHVFTESGLFGLSAFILLLYVTIKSLLIHIKNLQTKYLLLITLYLLLIILFFPPSLPLFFLLYVTIGSIAGAHQNQTNSKEMFESPKHFVIDIEYIVPLYITLFTFGFVIIATSGYFLGQAYASEFFFKQSQNGLRRNDVKALYDAQRQAIILNPYIERFHINFSQTNLLIANNIASRAVAASSQKQGVTPAQTLSEQDRKTFAEAIQAAIAESKSAVTLNPQKAVNWENLALIYRNIIGVAQGADTWTISAYQRAIVADPQNPIYRLNLGGVYYLLKNYEEATRIFEQAAGIKPNYANAYYNLAWANYQKGDFQKAVLSLQNAISLINLTTNKADYEKATKELEEFKKKLPKTQVEESQANTPLQQSELQLPSIAPQQIEPKIELPKESSPEAK